MASTCDRAFERFRCALRSGAFGSAEAGGYDRLSAQGETQSRMVGETLKAAGIRPDRLITGSLERQKKTLEAMGFDGDVEEHAGFNEYDFHDLLHVRFGGVCHAVEFENSRPTTPRSFLPRGSAASTTSRV